MCPTRVDRCSVCPARVDRCSVCPARVDRCSVCPTRVDRCSMCPTRVDRCSVRMRRDEEQRAAAEEESDEEPEEGESMEPPLPPDGGYGWVILFASFICNMLVDGVCFTFGLFYLEFLAYYGESRAKTSWVGSVLNGMYLSMGESAGVGLR